MSTLNCHRCVRLPNIHVNFAAATELRKGQERCTVNCVIKIALSSRNCKWFVWRGVIGRGVVRCCARLRGLTSYSEIHIMVPIFPVISPVAMQYKTTVATMVNAHRPNNQELS